MTIAELVKNQEAIKAEKMSKSIAFKTCSFSATPNRGTVTKADSNDEDNESNVIRPIINTTNWLDSHGDVHAKGIWGTEPIEGISYVIDHDYSVSGLIASPKDVLVTVERLRWKQLGLDVNGTTDALTFVVTLREYANESFIKQYNAGVPLQNSVRMIYEDLVLCVNEKEYEQEFKNWNAYRKEVANGEVADQLGYFWYIKKARVYLEGSAVLRGSNEITPVRLQQKEEQNAGDEPITNKNEVVKSTPVWYHLM